MKRVMIMGVRTAIHKTTKENVVYVTVFDLGNRGSNGVVYLPKNDDAVKSAYANQTKNLELYDKYVSLSVGDICEMTLSVNYFNGEIYISDLNVVEKTPYSLDDLYGKINDKK